MVCDGDFSTMSKLLSLWGIAEAVSFNQTAGNGFQVWSSSQHHYHTMISRNKYNFLWHQRRWRRRATAIWKDDKADRFVDGILSVKPASGALLHHLHNVIYDMPSRNNISRYTLADSIKIPLQQCYNDKSHVQIFAPSLIFLYFASKKPNVF